MKSIIYQVSRIFKEPKVVTELLVRRYPSLFPDRCYIGLIYWLRFGHKINWKTPQTFNEKLCWSKIYDRNPLYTRLADKYEVKKFVAQTIGKEYVVPNLGVWDDVVDIDYNSLPKQFVIKGTHDSSGAVIVKDKDNFDKEAVVEKYSKILKRNYFWSMREWPYKNIIPRMIVDQFLEDNTAGDREISLRDYKFWCFNGEPKYMYCTVKDKDIYENFYDKDFNPVDINHGFPRNIPEFDKPKNFEKMWELAGVLAKASQTAFVRVDFFNVDGKIYFGEFTFYDWAGLRPFVSEEQDYELGKFISLKNK